MSDTTCNKHYIVNQKDIAINIASLKLIYYLVSWYGLILAKNPVLELSVDQALLDDQQQTQQSRRRHHRHHSETAADLRSTRTLEQIL